MTILLVNVWTGLPIKGWIDRMFARLASAITQASIMPTYTNECSFHWSTGS